VWHGFRYLRCKPVPGQSTSQLDPFIAPAALEELSADQLSARLLGFTGEDAERRAAVTDAIGRAARELPPEAAAWPGLVAALDALHGAGASTLGRLPFVGDRLLELLLEEARSNEPADHSDRRGVGPAGRALASLAVSPKLRAAMSRALGSPVATTYDAVYLYDPPGSCVRTHVDRGEYGIVFHLILEHTGSGRSALVVHRAGGPERMTFAPGEGVALRGHGTIHSWEPLGPDESRILVAVGFRPAAE
jgi:hypothetical protein